MVIIDRIKALCKEKGLKQQYLFDSIGASRVLFSDWKHGKSKPTREKLIAIAAVLGTTPEYLTGETDDPNAPGVPISYNPVQRRVIDKVLRLSPEALAAVDKILDEMLS